MTTVIRVPMLVMSVSDRRPAITETMVVDMDKEHVAANFAIVENAVHCKCYQNKC